ncbi:tudor domain-containing protein 7-like [Thalassophryne amazonica]|uniref:tudor domain-containing protein 7-like n=1 Tax=Thalassophryne amazonica TaxID=390379 RepID=UPI0014715B6F|nr:tudor domain-containing protein 7-like [Thalassophryne amazonica]
MMNKSFSLFVCLLVFISEFVFPQMEDLELFQKTLRAILHMNKGRLSLTRLKSEYKLLTGENIAFRQMGHRTLMSLILSMPSIIHMQQNRFGEMMCFSSTEPQTAKVTSPQQVSKEINQQHQIQVHSDVRVRPAAPRVFKDKPQTPRRPSNPSGQNVGIIMTRDIRMVPSERRSSRPPSAQPPSSPAALSPELKLKLKELLKTFPHGLWAKALPKVFQDKYKTKLPEYVLENLDLLKDVSDIISSLPDDPKKVILYSKIPP